MKKTLSFFVFVSLFYSATLFAIDAPRDLITNSQPTDSRVILSWTPVPAATQYRVYRGTTLGSYTLLDSTTRTSYVDTTFSTTHTNYYMVRAYSGTESANSNAVSFTPSGLILSPGKIVIIVNDNSADSVEVGTYYSTQRSVPTGNICHVTTVTTETCTGAEYDTLAAQVDDFLDSDSFRTDTYCLLTTYGIPLKLSDSGGVAVDSKLSTLRAGTASNDYHTAGNTLVRRYDDTYSVYMVTRIDGANKTIAKGLVDKAKAAESNPNFYTSGIGVFDARRHAYSSVYAPGDIFPRDACLAARRIGLPVYFDDDDTPIHEGIVSSNVLVYWGWYTHYYGGINQKYPPDITFADLQDPFNFAPGAIAIHLESDTCSHIRIDDVGDWNAHWWVPWLINHKGVAASGGAVNEPLLSGFCKGDRFFDALTRGYSFAEAAYISTPSVNWMMCYVGDPLYTPFSKRLKNHYKVYGKRSVGNLLTSDSRYDEIGADGPTTTYFSQTYGLVYLDNWGASTEHRYVLDFPKTFYSEGGQVPADCDIVEAKLTVRCHQSANDTGPLNFYRITDPDGKGTWKQSTADTTTNVGVSWSYRDASTNVLWDNSSTQGGTFSAGDVIAYTSGMAWRKWVDVDVTTHVQSWADGAVNQGWIITLPSGQGDSFWGGDYTEAPVDAPLLEVTWNNGPVPDAGGNTTAMIGEIVPLDGSASYDPDFGPNALSFSWDFDSSDGIQIDATGATASHQYMSAGTYTVTLTVSDGKTTGTDTMTVTVSSSDITPPGITPSQAVIAGTASDASTISYVVVNGTNSNVTAGNWSSTVNLTGNATVVTITATDTNSNQTIIELNITY